jgi:hypothetical protein
MQVYIVFGYKLQQHKSTGSSYAQTMRKPLKFANVINYVEMCIEIRVGTTGSVHTANTCKLANIKTRVNFWP